MIVTGAPRRQRDFKIEGLSPTGITCRKRLLFGRIEPIVCFAAGRCRKIEVSE
jgi:hypothetical protein